MVLNVDMQMRLGFFLFHVLGYKLFKLILFLTGFFVGFFASYVICSLYLSDQISGKAADYKDQVFYCLTANCF